MKTSNFRRVILVFFSLLVFTNVIAQITAHEAITALGRGINMGNTLEPETEGGWNNGPAQEYYFDMYKNAGFSCVRIPVRWDKHTGTESPFTIDEDWLDRVEEIVDWGLDRELFIIINIHHEEPLKEDYSNQHVRYDSIWSQISLRFKDKSEKLLFEMVNEPLGLTQTEIDEFNVRVLGIIRKNNPTRIVIYSGNEWSGSIDLLNAAIPDVNDVYLMAYYHSYDPWDFAGLANGTWGSENDVQNTISRMAGVEEWSVENNMPVIIGEFGAHRNCDYNSRMYYYATCTEQALAHGMAFAEWDDGGDFETMFRADSSWNDIKDILIYTSDSSATSLTVELTSDSIVKLTWVSRSSSKQKVLIERRTLLTEFAVIAEVDAASSLYLDTDTEVGEYYIYRILDVYANTNVPSYPVRLYRTSDESGAYLGSPVVIPGIIEAENFDFGGEMKAYHDTDVDNQGHVYRLGEGVDIEERVDGYHVGFIEVGEWMEYTIDVEHAGKYTMRVYLASMLGGGSLQFDFDYVKSQIINVPATGGWTTMEIVTSEIELEAGEQIVKIDFISKPAFNIDKIEFVEYNSISEKEKIELSISPNPARNKINISMVGEEIKTLSIVDSCGLLIMDKAVNASQTHINIKSLKPGTYFVIVVTKKGTMKSKFVKI